MKLKIFSYKNVKSTNNVALRLLKSGHMSGAIISDVQSKGKGQHGKDGYQKKVIFLQHIFLK